VNRTRKAGTRALVVGLSVAAVACGSAAAATPSVWLRVGAHLAPVAGTKADGRFNGLLVRNGGTAQSRGAQPRNGSSWQLTWRLALPALEGPMTASIRMPAQKDAAPVARMLCTRCTATAHGVITLTGSQAMRIAGSHAVVVVQASSATLRGAVTVFTQIPIRR